MSTTNIRSLTPFRKLLIKVNPFTPLQVVASLASCLLFLASFGFPFTTKIFFIKAIRSGHGQSGTEECIAYGTIGYYRLPVASDQTQRCLVASKQSRVPDVAFLVQGPDNAIVIVDLVVHAIAFSLSIGLIITSSISRKFPAAAKLLPYVTAFAIITPTIAYLMDLILFVIADHNAKSYSIIAGPANWLTIGAWLLLLVGTWCYQSICYGREQLEQGSKLSSVSLPYHNNEEAAFTSAYPADLDALGQTVLDAFNPQLALTLSRILLPAYIATVPLLAQGAIPRGERLKTEAIKEGPLASLSPLRRRIDTPGELVIAVDASASRPDEIIKTRSLSAQPLGAYAPSEYSSYYSDIISRVPSKSSRGRRRTASYTFSPSNTFSPSRISSPSPYATMNSSDASWLSRKMALSSPIKTILRPPKRRSSTPPVPKNQSTSSLMRHSHEFPPMPDLPKPTYKPYSTFSVGGFIYQNQRRSAQQAQQKATTATRYSTFHGRTPRRCDRDSGSPPP